MSADNWVHRSAGMLCHSCMYYCPKKDMNNEETLGRCRRHAPTMSGWPVMFPHDWCGDHKLNENSEAMFPKVMALSHCAEHDRVMPCEVCMERDNE